MKTCKQCGSRLQVLPGLETAVCEQFVDRYAPRHDELPWRTRAAGRTIACTGCEYVEEVGKP